MATQVILQAERRDDEHKGKGAAKRLRKTGRVPAIVYGMEVDATALHVDNRELYHALHTSAGRNVLIRLSFDGDEHLSIIREVQRDSVRGDMLHVDFQAVDRNVLYPAEIPVHLTNEDAPRQAGGIVNHVLYTVPIYVKPLEVPESFTLDLDGLEIGDVLRVSDLADQLPAGAEWDIEEDRTVVTINAPTQIVEEEEEEAEGLLEEFAGEGEEPEGEEPEAADEEGGEE
jgi:large subunit ribosomal protein L25